MEGGSIEKGRLNRVLYKIINECFPYYLPKFMHSMDFSEIREQDDIVSSIGRAATHFVISNVSHGSQLYADLSKATAMKTDLETFERLLTYLENMRSWIEPDFEKCEDPEDFLLEPWVLIQLPFHPAVAHQWLVAAWAEYLSFKKQIAFLKFISMPLEMIPLVHQLFELSLVLLESLNKLFGFLECSTMTKNPCHPEVFDLLLRYYCSPCFSETVSILQFVLSGKCHNMINSLKRQAWNLSTREQCLPLLMSEIKELKSDEEMIHLYSYKFWMKENVSEIFGKQAAASLKKKKKAKNKGKKKDKEPLLPFEEPKFDLKVDLVVLGQFIEDHILAPGWLKGISKEKLLLLVERNCCQKGMLLRAYHRFIWFSETSKGICAEDSGVQQNLMNLTSEAEAEEALAELIDTLHFIAKSAEAKGVHPSAERVYLDAVNCEGPHFALSEMEKIISGVKIKSKIWSMERILDKIQKQCPPPDLLISPSCPDFEDQHFFDKMMSSFEARVKHIALTMYKGQLGIVTGKEKRKSFLELQVVQYILPWVVTSIWDLVHQHGRIVVGQNVWKYIWFVHSLISQYEGERCHFVTIDSPVNFSNLLMHSEPKAFLNSLLVKCILIPDLCEQIFDASEPYNQEVFEVLTKPFYYFMQGLDVLDEDKQWQELFTLWAQYAYRFISKVYLALESTAKNSQIHLTGLINDNMMYGELALASSLLCAIVVKNFSKGISRLICEEFYKIGKNALNDLEAAHNRGIISEDKFKKLKNLEADKMSAVFFYLGFTKIVPRMQQNMKKILQLNRNPLDSLEVAFNAFMTEDLRKVKLSFANWRHSCDLKSPNLVSLRFAKKNMHLYEPVLSSLGRHNKVKMVKPGEITFFPIKHCHWCGLVDWPEFRICQLCKETDEYLDKIMFCSEKCELQAMEDVHGEEHCQFILQSAMVRRDMLP